MIDLSKILDLTTAEEEISDCPSYLKKGRILVHVHCISEPLMSHEFEITVLDYDSDSSVFWMMEGIGVDYWLNHMDYVKEFNHTTDGVYLFTGIRGEITTGNGWDIDFDEDWHYDAVTKMPDDTKELPSDTEYGK